MFYQLKQTFILILVLSQECRLSLYTSVDIFDIQVALQETAWI